MAGKRAVDPDEVVMSFGDHIEELRRRLIYALVGVAVALVFMLWYGRELMAFLYAPLWEILKLADLPKHSYPRSTVAGFSIYLKVSIIGAMILSGPWVLYQLWRFIEAGLYEAERRTASILMGLSCVMTALALVFMYYIFLPAMLAFFILWSTSYTITET
jgi:sec-independent protein translocase protein TatC